MNRLQDGVIVWNASYDVLHWYEPIQRKIDTFAAALATKNGSANYYSAERNAGDPLGDIKLGKYGEIFTNQVLICKMGYPSIPVDFTVLDSGSKSWEADLPYRKKDRTKPNVHVKTCSKKTGDYSLQYADSRYTWTFQWGNKTGKWGKDELFTKGGNNDVVALVYIPSLASRICTLVATIPWRQLQPLLKDPISPKLLGLKKCFYSKDLPEQNE